MPTFEQTWLPFLYLYFVGGLFFLSGMILIRKAGSVDLNRPRHKYWWRILIFGYFYFLIIHAIMIIAALYF